MSAPQKHIILSDTKESKKFSPVTGGGNENLPHYNPFEHGADLLAQFESLWRKDEDQRENLSAVRTRGGTYICFTSVEDVSLKLKSFEQQNKGVRLLNATFLPESNKEKALVFLPDTHKDFFEKKIESYRTEVTFKGNPKQADFAGRIQEIALTNTKDFWLDDISLFPREQAIWCEIWIAFEQKEVDSQKFFDLCTSLSIEHSKNTITFPERIVTLCRVNQEDIQKLVNSTGCIAEIHKAKEPASLFIKDGDARKWTTELKSRLQKGDLNTRICILDTGLNRRHPLLEDVTNDRTVQSVNDSWTPSDKRGHGTAMAGICEYFELEDKLLSSEPIVQDIAIESVKILPDMGDNNRELLGNITEDAVNIAQATVNDVNRIHCMAVTQETSIDELKNQKEIGKPTSWSAKLDNIISGYEDNQKKMFLVSAGNISPDDLNKYKYPYANYAHCVESPAQAWNALTVGAVSTKVQIEDEQLKDYKPVAENGDLCPFSSTSNNENWGKDWPIKPEVLFEGGNAIYNGSVYDGCHDTSLLTTRNQFLLEPLTTINATSAATAQASYVAAMLHKEYSELWPETIRGLIVHSAEWTPIMMNKFPNMDKKTDGRKKLLHTYGYGVASLSRAKDSYNNAATMIIQDELQPFLYEGRDVKLNEMNLHSLPIPKEFLLSLGDTCVRLKITLSYFVEASPDSKGWQADYKYSSCGLRFDINGVTEDKDAFLSRINRASRKEDYEKPINNPNSDRWYLGAQNRDVGSIHSDFWQGTAAELAESEFLAVYPVSGWWKTRKKLESYGKKVRYALIVSLNTDIDADIYSAIQTEIVNKVGISIKV